jgi:hypothetical protein
MRRILLIGAALAAITWFQFDIYPGHSYLRGATQLYVPMLQRLATPGYLSRDLVATHPDFTYTIYDEVTLFLHDAGKLSFQSALEQQQIVFRFLGLFGLFLICRASHLKDSHALALSAAVNLGSWLAGPQVGFPGLEPTSGAFAFALVLLAVGCLSGNKPVLAGLAGGMALMYDILIAAPFWIVVILSVIFAPNQRKLLRPALTSLLVFVLLLGNLAQLQPGVGQPVPFLTKIPPDVWSILRFRTPFVWPSEWGRVQIFIYVAILVVAIWAATTLAGQLKGTVRWFVFGLPFLGFLSLGATMILLDRFRWSLMPNVQPARLLLFMVCFTALLSGMAAIRFMDRRAWLEGLLWCVATGCVLYVPRVSPIALNAETPLGTKPSSLRELANWAEANTWGSSLFLFPDAGQVSYPSVFRALSRRGLWVDWDSGLIGDSSDAAARIWWDRWNETMHRGFSVQRMQRALALPVDYWVLRRSHTLECNQNGYSVIPRWSFMNDDFLAYDAESLRRLTCTLEIDRPHAGG